MPWFNRRSDRPASTSQRSRLIIRVCSRRGLMRLAALGLALGLIALFGWYTMFRMPGESYAGPMPDLNDAQQRASERLQHDVQRLAGEWPNRNVHDPNQLRAAADWLESTLRDLHDNAQRIEYEVHNITCANIEAERPGTTHPDEIVIIGAHYDSAPGTPGANDNGSGVAALLELARRFSDASPKRTLRFVCFVNEEPPFFQTEDMGAMVYAHRCKQRHENIVAMISLETIGYYRDEPDSQNYPLGLGAIYPDRGNFIAFVSNLASRDLLQRAIGVFRQHATFPSHGGAIPAGVPGAAWSDHWAFWELGYPALMLTDTAPYRYPHYHQPTDTPDKIDYDRLSLLVDGLEAVVDDLIN